MKTRLIVNPAAGRGAAGRQWPRLEEALRTEGFSYEYVMTERRGHASELARAAVKDGIRWIVAVGGDGTLHEVVNGLLADGEAGTSGVELGIIAAGTGADFARTAGLPHGMLAGAQRLARATQSRPLDVGEVTFSREGGEGRRYFINVAGMGFDGEVIARLERKGKRGSGTIPYLTAIVATVLAYRGKDVEMRIDDLVLTSAINSVVVCNGQYFGGGMRVGPQARVDDAKLDFVVLSDTGKLEFLANFWRVYRGTHLSHPKIKSYTCQTVAVAPQQRMLVQADGELLGAGPATFRILPAALRLRV